MVSGAYIGSVYEEFANELTQYGYAVGDAMSLLWELDLRS